MKSECCNAEVKWVSLVPYCSKCRKYCKIKDKDLKSHMSKCLKIVEDKLNRGGKK